MSKTKKQLKAKICQLRTEIKNAIKISNARFSQLSAAQQSIKRLQDDKSFLHRICDRYHTDSMFDEKRIRELEAKNKTLEANQEKPWIFITDDPESLPKESGWYQVYHETDTYPYPVMPCFYSEGAWEKGFILAWKPLSDKPTKDEQ